MVVCTKLVRWMAAAAVFLELWYAIVTGWLPISISPQVYQAILPMPLYALMCFGCYSMATVGYRLMTFNDCTEAAQELRKDIQDARRDLASKGLDFSSRSQ